MVISKMKMKTKIFTIQKIVLIMFVFCGTASGYSGDLYNIYLTNGNTLKDYQVLKSKTNPHILILKKNGTRTEIRKSSVSRIEKSGQNRTVAYDTKKQTSSTKSISNKCSQHYERCILKSSNHLTASELKSVCFKVKMACRECIGKRSMSESSFNRISNSMISEKSRYVSCKNIERPKTRSKWDTGYENEYESSKRAINSWKRKQDACKERFNKKMMRLEKCVQ